MPKETKVTFLKSVLESPYDQIKFQKFTMEFLNEPDMLQAIRRTDVGAEYEKHIEDYAVIAKYEDNDGNKIIVLSVTLHKNRSVEHARTLQRNFISKFLEQQNSDAAIVAFYSNEEVYWRLSFVRLDYTFTDKGLALDLTPAKRFSYLVGVGEPSHTAQAQLLPILENDIDNPTIDEVEKAFSVEKVTKDFFELYKDKYLQLKDYLEQDEAFINETKKLGFEVPKFAEQFSKKLLGQLAFLYFIQKKGWLGVRILPENHILSDNEYQAIYMKNDEPRKKVLEKVFIPIENEQRKISSQALLGLNDYETELFSDCFVNTPFHQPWGRGERKFISTIFKICVKNKKNFFDDYLEPLFYAALNKKRKNHYFNQFNCKIPFLNGGLFEPLEGYHWRDVNFNIPNHLFSNEEEKGRKANGILDIFERFNFTMNEDEPLEKEVAVDPEMLGKIFENLLDVQDRKSKGAFYTPREIVHYMCQESLVNYLVNEVDVPYEDIREFILYGDLIRDMDSRSEADNKETFRIKPSVHNNIVNIDSALANIKVADPAVGSGAFPLGLLSEIVRARNNITNYLIRLDKEGKLGRNIGEHNIRKNRQPYYLKRETIRNSIFAVDIEPSAVDITKLRLWLSVVVDQEINEENPYPKPLPNLDMNIMVGNSLIDEYEGIKLFDESILHSNKLPNSALPNAYYSEQLSFLVDHSDKMLEEMFRLQYQYFDEDLEDKKQEWLEKIDNLRDNLIEYKLGRDGNNEGLKKYEELKKKKQKPYFLWHLEFAKVFKEKGGFDIVIGNPPYLGFHKVPNKNYFKEKYFSANGKYDFYILFIEKGIQLLKDKGTISYICPSYFYKRNYGKKLRELILKDTKINYICDFNDSQIFESALTYTCIFSFENHKANNDDMIRVQLNGLGKDDHYIRQNSLKEPSWLLEKDEYQQIINKIRNKSSFTLGDITKSISQGIVTGNNDVFILNQGVIAEYQIEYEYLEKVYKGRDIRSGSLVSNDAYLFYPYRIGVDNKNYLVPEEDIQKNSPNLYHYLLSNKDILLSRDYFNKSNKKWYELWNPRNRSHFESRKFVFSEINDTNDFVLVNKCFYSDSACGMELKVEFKIYENYLLKYLNSKLITAIYRKISVPKANGYLIYKNAFLNNLPIALVELEDEKIKGLDIETFLIDLFELTADEIEKLELTTDETEKSLQF